MRLRSSQLVFLMLLICSVRLGEEYAAQLTASIAGPLLATPATRDDSIHAVSRSSLASPATPAAREQLAPAARAAYRVVWAMPSPASASAALVSHTSLLRT